MKVTIKNIGQLVTMRGPARGRIGQEMSDIGVITDGEVHIEGSHITFAGSRADAPTLDGFDEIDAHGSLVTPGLVDAHTHAVFAGDRSDEIVARSKGATYQEIAANGGGIFSTVRETRKATEEELRTESSRHFRWMQSCGTTTAEVKSGYGLNLNTEVKMLRVAENFTNQEISIVRTFLGAHAVPPEAKSKDDYLHEVVDIMLPVVARDCEYVDMFVEDNYFSPDDARRLARKAREFNLGLRLHVDQMRDSGGAILAAELNADTADHLEFTSTDGIRALVQSKTVPILLPSSVLGLNSDHYPDARQMIAELLPIVVASDYNPGTSPSPSLPLCIHLSVKRMGMSVAEAITACTINAAYSLRRGNKIGSLEAGKIADILIWEFKDYRDLSNWTGYSPLQKVIKDGRVTLDNSGALSLFSKITYRTS